MAQDITDFDVNNMSPDALDDSELPQVPTEFNPQRPFSLGDDLRFMRHKLPFIQIMPFPTLSVIVAVAANGVADIKIPDNAMLVQLTSNNPFYLSTLGNADGLTSAQQMAANNDYDSANLLMTPNDVTYYYCGNKKSLSVMGITNGTVIGAKFVGRDQL